MLKMSRFNFLIPALVILLLLPGCTTVHTVIPGDVSYDSKIRKLNYLGDIYSSDIYLTDSTLVEASEIVVVADTLTYTDDETDAVVQLPVSRVDRIEIKDNVNSAFNIVWMTLGSWFASALISIATISYGPAILGLYLTPATIVYAYFFTGVKEFKFTNSVIKKE